MTLGEKILGLRKSKNLSQEQLAEALNVSRQALSKWELGDSLPDINNIIAVSDYFAVSTDYLLKDTAETDIGKAAAHPQQSKEGNSSIAMIISTALVLIGLLLSWALANDGTLPTYWPFSRAVPGIIVQIIGISFFEIVHIIKKLPVTWQYLFWTINIWILAPMPLILLGGAFFRQFVGCYSILQYLIAVFFAYLALCTITSGICIWRHTINKGKS